MVSKLKTYFKWTISFNSQCMHRSRLVCSQCLALRQTHELPILISHCKSRGDKSASCFLAVLERTPVITTRFERGQSGQSNEHWSLGLSSEKLPEKWFLVACLSLEKSQNSGHEVFYRNSGLSFKYKTGQAYILTGPQSTQRKTNRRSHE